MSTPKIQHPQKINSPTSKKIHHPPHKEITHPKNPSTQKIPPPKKSLHPKNPSIQKFLHPKNPSIQKIPPSKKSLRQKNPSTQKIPYLPPPPPGLTKGVHAAGVRSRGGCVAVHPEEWGGGRRDGQGLDLTDPRCRWLHARSRHLSSGP